MRVKYHFLPKQQVTFCKISDSGEEALHIMNETGFRAIPVLAEDEKKFMGIIYKVDLLEKKCEIGLEKLSTEHMLEDSSACIFEKDSFFRAFYVIRRLPFLAVLNDYNEFVGILTHSNIFDVIEDSFGMRTGGYILTIATQDCKGTIKELGTLLKAFNIGGLFTLDNGDQYIRRVIVNIADELNEKRLKQLIEKIEKKGFRVSHVDYI
ncbi:cyclic di-AMP binding protein CbpA [Bacillus mobilis]|uniref:CBS domain-containing protein n=2 Tax=Bacillus cereus group TaxID=86661 RepID=A0A1C4AU75_BACCE|nr:MULTISPECIES: cyclic di-AMP binding protein CbpA [Bacillus cereus group]MCC2459289.1 cyclic di-AMP binding protein CbpA [Bacillus mobilis]MCU5435168.1 cyclic di-AMP binding protein CbpA [Bacillus mobilis]MCU5591840.1 cyclic di-AMP binding protein CbpA [Bacillus mobilis]MCU5736812.1 cyclic di-AMP binding protein CbpA [Bacillus mobilis]MCU9557746.1 cyclic di-AMP binding protein CbpA [Bacillus mobilis]